MDLISNVFYRTHFDVYPAGEDQNVFGEITKYIIGWCKYKAKLYGITLDWDWRQFKQYGSFDGNRMKAYSTQFVDKERNATYWAAKVDEIGKAMDLLTGPGSVNLASNRKVAIVPHFPIP